MPDEEGGRVGRPDPSLELLARAAQAVHGTTDVDAKLMWVADAARSLTGAPFAAYVPDAGEGAEPVVSGRLPPAFAAIATRALAAANDASDGRPLRRPADGLVTAAVVGSDGGLHGVLVAGRVDAGELDDHVVAGFGALAAHLGIALDNVAVVTYLAELEATRREVVHRLQEAVRPPTPVVEQTELGVHYEPAERSAPTGGDLYDWLVLPDGDLQLVVVDVVGKGVAATKEALLVTHAVRLLALDGCPLKRIVARADELVTAQNPDMVATLLVARYRPGNGSVRLVGGGHPPALVIRPGRRPREIYAPGVAIGWPGAGSDEVVTLTLGPSDALVLYTDGLIEGGKDIEQGLTSLADAAVETAAYPAPALARALVERALSGAARRDDSLALVLRRRAPVAARPLHQPSPFEYRFSAAEATIPLGRHLLSDWLEHLQIGEIDAADLVLVASELCTNAARYGEGHPGSLVLRAWADADSVGVEVEDDGPGFERPLPDDDDPPAPDAAAGRGLWLVRSLTDEVSVERADGATVVRAVKRSVLPV